MISFVRGRLLEKGVDTVTVETAAGIGFQIYMPGNLMAKLPSLGEEICLHTSFQVREDGMSLYGFFHREDLEMFRLLITVNGVGPRAALGILSVITADDLRFAVLAEDVKAISKAPGIGAKTARKIILDLKDKLQLEEALEMKLLHAEEQAVSGAPEGGATSGAASEAVLALTALGYSNSEALRAVSQIEGVYDMDVEDILKAALKQMHF